jgi:hypothetical protein
MNSFIHRGCIIPVTFIILMAALLRGISPQTMCGSGNENDPGHGNAVQARNGNQTVSPNRAIVLNLLPGGVFSSWGIIIDYFSDDNGRSWKPENNLPEYHGTALQ